MLEFCGKFQDKRTDGLTVFTLRASGSMQMLKTENYSGGGGPEVVAV